MLHTPKKFLPLVFSYQENFRSRSASEPRISTMPMHREKNYFEINRKLAPIGKAKIVHPKSRKWRCCGFTVPQTTHTHLITISFMGTPCKTVSDETLWESVRFQCFLITLMWCRKSKLFSFNRIISRIFTRMSRTEKFQQGIPV